MILDTVAKALRNKTAHNQKGFTRKTPSTHSGATAKDADTLKARMADARSQDKPHTNGDAQSASHDGAKPLTDEQSKIQERRKMVESALDNVSLPLLLQGAAQLRSRQPAMEELRTVSVPSPSAPDAVLPAGSGAPQQGAPHSGRKISFEELDALVHHYALRFNLLGLQPGEHIVLLSVGTIEAMAALFAALKASLHVTVLSPVTPLKVAIKVAQKIRACALAGPVAFQGLRFDRFLFDIAIETPSVRLLASFGAQKMDGAVSLDAGRNYTVNYPPLAASIHGTITTVTLPQGAAEHGIGAQTQAAYDGEPVLATHGQQDLIALGLKIINALGLNSSQALVSSLMPCSLAGLIFGPMACLLSGAVLHFAVPLSAPCLEAIGTLPGHCQLIVPIRLGAALIKDAQFLEIRDKTSVFVANDMGLDPAFGDTHAQTQDRPRFGALARHLCRQNADGQNPPQRQKAPNQSEGVILTHCQNTGEKFTFMRYDHGINGRAFGNKAVSTGQKPLQFEDVLLEESANPSHSHKLPGKTGSGNAKAHGRAA